MPNHDVRGGGGLVVNKQKALGCSNFEMEEETFYYDNEIMAMISSNCMLNYSLGTVYNFK